MLSAWTALWHPQLLSKYRSTPVFRRPDEVGKDKERLIAVGSLILCPPQYAAALESRTGGAEGSDLKIIVSESTRRETLSRLGTDIGQQQDQALSEDFFSLGFAWLQLRLLARQIRYGSQMDTGRFENSLLEASDAWSKGASPVAHLQNCFDLLLAERCQYYPTDANLYELLLAEPPGNRKRLRKTLESNRPQNVLLSGSSVRELFEPRTGTDGGLTELLRNRIRERECSLAGSADIELPALLMHHRSAIFNTARGFASIEELTGIAPIAWARRKMDLTPLDPAIARSSGCQIALHMAFDSVAAPKLSCPTPLWEATDNREDIRTMAEKAIDAGRPDHVLSIGAVIGEAIDSWHYAHVVIAYWPGTECESWNDFLTTVKYGPILGRFQTFDSAAETMESQSYGESLDADAYERWPDTGEGALEVSLVKYWQWMPEILAIRKSVAMMLVGYRADPIHQPEIRAFFDHSSRIVSQLHESFARQQLSHTDLAGAIKGLRDQGQRLVRGLIPDKSASERHVLVNPTLNPRDELIEINGKLTPGQQPVTTIHGAAAQGIRLLEKFHPVGECWSVHSPPASLTFLDESLMVKDSARKRSGIIDGSRLRNASLEIGVNQKTGGISVIRTPGGWGSVASQRVSLRLPNAGVGNAYAEPVMKSLEWFEEGMTRAGWKATGILHVGEAEVARYVQTVSLERFFPLARIDWHVELLDEFDLKWPVGGVVSRLAWKDEMAHRYRYLLEQRERCCRQRFSSPYCTEIESEGNRITLVAPGAIWHRQSALNVLDTLLPTGQRDVVNGRNSTGSMYVGVNVANTGAAISRIMTPATLFSIPGNPEGLQFRLMAGGAHSLDWADAECLSGESNELIMVLHFRETAGKAGESPFRFARRPDSVFLGDMYGKAMKELPFANGQIVVSWRAWQVFSLVLRWNS